MVSVCTSVRVCDSVFMCVLYTCIVSYGVFVCVCVVPFSCVHYTHSLCHTAIPIIIEGQFQVFQRFSSSKLVLKTVESCFVAHNYYGNGSRVCVCVRECACVRVCGSVFMCMLYTFIVSYGVMT